MSENLAAYFMNKREFTDISLNPFFLGHIGELAWLTNEGILNREKDTGLFVPTEDWKIRGEVAVAVLMSHMNVIYNAQDHMRRSPLLNPMVSRSHILIASQFWLYTEFKELDIGISLDHSDTIFAETHGFYRDRDLYAKKVGLVGDRLEAKGLDAMTRLSGTASGLFREWFLGS